MINRAAVLLRYKQPAIDWINRTDSSDGLTITLDMVNEDEKIVYLIDESSDEDLEEMIIKNHKILFENELKSWYPDASLWPKNLTYKLFNNWFEIEYHSVVEDLGRDVPEEL